jgi:hypothetical protein
MTFNAEKTLGDTKKVLGVIAVVATSMVVAIDLIMKEIRKLDDRVDASTETD